VLFAPGPTIRRRSKRSLTRFAEADQCPGDSDSGLSVADIAALGVRRISVGGALALAAWTSFTRAAQKLKSEGSFAGFASLVSYPDIKRVLRDRLPHAAV